MRYQDKRIQAKDIADGEVFALWLLLRNPDGTPYRGVLATLENRYPPKVAAAKVRSLFRRGLVVFAGQGGPRSGRPLAFVRAPEGCESWPVVSLSGFVDYSDEDGPHRAHAFLMSDGQPVISPVSM